VLPGLPGDLPLEHVLGGPLRQANAAGREVIQEEPGRVAALDDERLAPLLVGSTHTRLIIRVALPAVGASIHMTPAIPTSTSIFLPCRAGPGIDPIHFGIIMVLNLCIGLCTPPVGSVLFVGCGVAGIGITRVIRPLMPLFIAMVVGLFLVTYFPELSLWLPRLFGY
jgi:TRAP-type C4-dicarboxylate transport system permease large subunit